MNPHPDPTAIELRSADFSPPLSGPPKTAGSGLKSAFLSCRNSLNSMAVHPDPLPLAKGEGNFRWHRVQVTEQGSKTAASLLSSPRSEGGEEQGEGLFRLHTYG